MTTPQDTPPAELLDVIEGFIAHEVGEHNPFMREQAKDFAAWLSAAGYRIIRSDDLQHVLVSLNDVLDYTDRHRVTYPEHDHDCFEEWCVERDSARMFARRVVGNEQDTPADGGTP